MSSPAIGADGAIYVGSDDKMVYALDGQTGSKKWEFKTGGEISSSPAIGADGTVYAGSNNKNVYAIDGETGAKKWAFRTGSFVDSSPAIGADGTVYMGSDDLRVYALDGKTGQRKWAFDTDGRRVSSFLGLPGEVYSSPAIGADSVVYVAEELDLGSNFPAAGPAGVPSCVYALDAQTGKLRWDFRAGGGIRSSPAIGAHGLVYVGCRDRNVYALRSGSDGGLQPGSPWPMFHGNSLHTGRSAGSGAAGTPPAGGK